MLCVAARNIYPAQAAFSSVTFQINLSMTDLFSENDIKESEGKLLLTKNLWGHLQDTDCDLNNYDFYILISI